MGNYELNMIDHTYAIPVDTMREAFPHLSVASESEQDNSQADGTSVEQTDWQIGSHTKNIDKSMISHLD